jgi:2-oxoglutarate dehydrogenase E2 component (dihydrolipoamide succinyltransferase)
MPTEVLMPQMGESIAEGTITRWLVKVGDKIERDQPLFEISTDKVDAEIPSPESGVLLEVRGNEGDTVAVNEVVALIGEPGEAAGAAPATETVAEPSSEPGAEAPATPEGVEEGEAAGAEKEPEIAESEEAEAVALESEDAESEEAQRRRTASSPVVRKIAAEHGIDLRQVSGTGIHGRVTKRDILGFIETGGDRAAADDQAPPARASVAPAPAAAPSTTEIVAPPPQRTVPAGFYVPPYSEGEPVEIEPMSKIRQITSAHMTYSKATSAHVTTVFHMDLSKVWAQRNRAKNGFLRAHGTKLTYMPFIFQAVATALKANPKINASVDGTNIVYKKDINIGMAVALDWGLLVPVVRKADELSLVGLARTANDLAERARSKKLSPDELKGGTFTVTNPGVFGSLFGMPIINQPQVAILGLGEIEKRAVVTTDKDGNDSIVIKPMSYFAITYDHRLVDGADADRFMNHIKRTLVEESWSELDAF